MMLCLRSYLLVTSVLKVSLAIHINFIKVPSAVQNNSGQSVILDCNFSYRADDIDLVVKWFLNDDIVYKWIPSQKPQALGHFKHKLDLNYTITDDPKAAHRAMKILNPTTSDAGEYKCFISTFVDEDFSARNMTVFEPENKLRVDYNSSSSVVNFTCVADGVYPEPKVFLYEGQMQENFKYVPLLPLEWNTRVLKNGRFRVSVVAAADAGVLAAGSLIYCEMRIPGTGYVKRKAILYYPADYRKNGGNSHTPSTVEKVAASTYCLLLIYYHRFITNVQ